MDKLFLYINVSSINNSINNTFLIFLALEKALEAYLSYGEKKIQAEGLEALDTTFLDVLADMLKSIKNKMMKFAEPIMLLAKNILTLKVRTKGLY